MCGIACLVGGKSSPYDCFKALEKLEYRGYDSAGISVLTRAGIEVFKKQGGVEKLQDFAKNTKSNFAISHTRWATHGEPNETNAHPHVSHDKKLALVHNGIIENYKEIREELISHGINMISQTDSECALELISTTAGSLIERVKKASLKLKGSYALAILDKDNKCVVGIRKNSPLYVAQTTQGIMLASDIICFSGLAKSYYAIKEGELVVITKRKIKIYDESLKPIKPEFALLSKTHEQAVKGNYEYFMEKEIHEIPAIIKRIVAHYKNIEAVEEVLSLFKGIDRIKLIGCGTAYHAGMYGAKVLEKVLQIPCDAYIASEYKYSEPIVNQNTLGIFVSQSGETADTLGCASLMKRKGAKTLTITNVTHSALANMCDKYLPVCAGAEIGVASTKAYVAQILVLYILSKYLEDKNYDLSDIISLADKAITMIDIDKDVVDLIMKSKKVFYIGRGFDSITALEGALKLKEITYISTEGYPAGELKHGTIALIEQGTPVVAFATDRQLLGKTLSACEEVRSRGASVILVSPVDEEYYGYDYKMNLPENMKSELLSILSIIPFQLLALEVSKGLGYNPDKPRNLAKSVTVE